MMISICPGDQLLLTCNTSTSLQQWSILDTNTGMLYTRFITVSSSIGQFTPHQIQSFTFNFAVISTPGALPLISTLSVDGVTAYLNMSVIGCLESDTGNRLTTIVHVFGYNPFESRLHAQYSCTFKLFLMHNKFFNIRYTHKL